MFFLERGVFKSYISWLLELLSKDRGIRAYTMHVGFPVSLAFCGEKRCTADIFSSFFEELFEERIKILDEIAKDYPIAIENAGGFHRRDLRAILLQTENIKFTMDIGHLESVPTELKEEEFSFFEKMKNRIINVHVHDNRGNADEHLPLGEGSIDFNFYREFIKDIDPYLIVEVRPVDKAIWSYKRLVELF